MVAPYGLVAKAGIWYMVYSRNEAIYVHRVSDLLDVRISQETFERPDDFDLVRFWKNWCEEFEIQLMDFTVVVRVAPDFIPELPRYFGNEIRAKVKQAGPPNEQGWVTVELAFESFEAARDRILGFGRGVEVLEPVALRKSVLDFAEQIISLYQD